MGRGGSASLPRPARRSGRSARPPQPRCRHCRPHTSEPGLTAQLRAGCRRLIGARAAGATSAHRGPRRRQASARRNPRQQPGCRPRSRSGLSSGAPGLDRPFSPPPPAVSCLFNGRMGMRAARLVRQARCAPAEEPSPAVRRKRVRAVAASPPVAPSLQQHGKLLLWPAAGLTPGRWFPLVPQPSLYVPAPVGRGNVCRVLYIKRIMPSTKTLARPILSLATLDSGKWQSDPAWRPNRASLDRPFATVLGPFLAG